MTPTRYAFIKASWHADVPVWGGVRYRDLYPGIDLELHGARGHLEHERERHGGHEIRTRWLRLERSYL